MVINLPYQIEGTITDSNSANPSGIPIIIRNDRTIETISATTDSSGKYLADLGNLTSGYNIGDQITVIARYGLEDGSESFTTINEAAHTINITTSVILASTDAEYATITEVLEELGDKTTSDISAERVRNNLLRAEAEIDARTGTSFRTNTITDEVYDINTENLYISPNRAIGGSYLARSDAGVSSGLRTQLRHRPLISVTSLSTNGASEVAADDWTARTEHTGTVAGDFNVYKHKGIIEWLQNTPAFKRRAFKITYTWGIDRDTTDPEEKRKLELVRQLAILIAVRQILMSKGHDSQFEDIDNISLDGISVSGGITDRVVYQKNIRDRIEELFKELGTMTGWGIGQDNADYLS